MSARLKPEARPQISPEDQAWVRSMVIFEDEEVLVLDKPSGLSSQGGRIKAHTLDDLLWAFVKPSGRRPVLVHRLDRDTSGVILAAKSKPAAGFLGKALMGKQFRKTYLAVVTPGAPEPRDGAIDLPLRREEIGREAYMRVARDAPDADPALTRYRTLAEGEGAALVECEPETGRMHQLRVHLAALQRPIAGDARYGGALMLAGQPVPRLMLHAVKLQFPHPTGGTRTIEAPLPRDIAAVMEAARLQ